MIVITRAVATEMAHRWFVRRPGISRPLRLYCFSYAGGNATSYLEWQGAMPQHVEICGIQLPGRGARLGEEAFRDMSALVGTLARLLADVSDRPFAFFGHSLGALIGFEIARALARFGGPQPERLIVSGCHAPRYREAPKNYHLLDDSALVDVLRDYDATPAAVLAAPDLLALLLPTIRADFAIAETYRYHPSTPLSVPLTVFAGRDDERTCIEQFTGWATETRGPCDEHWFNGGHFFIHSQRREVLDTLALSLKDLASPMDPGR